MNPTDVIYSHLSPEQADRVWRRLRARDLIAGVYFTDEEILWAQGDASIGRVGEALKALQLEPDGYVGFLPRGVGGVNIFSETVPIILERFFFAC